MKKRLKIVTINFNQSDLTIKFLQMIYQQNFKDFDLVIVDNNSDILEVNKLKAFTKYNFTLIELKENIGFSRGNNIGAKYNLNDYDYILFINNDAFFTNHFDLLNIIDKMDKYKSDNVVSISPLINTVSMKKPAMCQQQNKKITSFYKHLVASSTVLKRLPYLKKLYNEVVNLDLLPYDNDTDYLTDTINGACFIVTTKFLIENNFFDEGTFLYGEEIIFGHQIKDQNKKCMLITNVIVDHFQGSSVKKTSFNNFIFKCRKNSELYYLTKYLKIDWIKKITFMIVKFIDYMALFFVSKVKKGR